MTTTKRDKRIKELVQIDGDQCFYCKKMGIEAAFVPGHPHLKRELDHLNRNEQDHRLENLVLSHAICNIKHRDYHPEISILAQEKLKENVRNTDRTPLNGSDGGKESEWETQKTVDKETHELKETDINMTVNKLVQAYLDEKLPKDTDKVIFYSTALTSIHYLTISQTGGRGSEQAVRRSIDAHCSEYAPWQDYKDGTGKRMIRRRMEN